MILPLTWIPCKYVCFTLEVSLAATYAYFDLETWVTDDDADRLVQVQKRSGASPGTLHTTTR